MLQRRGPSRRECRDSSLRCLMCSARPLVFGAASHPSKVTMALAPKVVSGSCATIGSPPGASASEAAAMSAHPAGGIVCCSLSLSLLELAAKPAQSPHIDITSLARHKAIAPWGRNGCWRRHARECKHCQTRTPILLTTRCITHQIPSARLPVALTAQR